MGRQTWRVVPTKPLGHVRPNRNSPVLSLSLHSWCHGGGAKPEAAECCDSEQVDIRAIPLAGARVQLWFAPAPSSGLSAAPVARWWWVVRREAQVAVAIARRRFRCKRRGQPRIRDRVGRVARSHERQWASCRAPPPAFYEGTPMAQSGLSSRGGKMYGGTGSVPNEMDDDTRLARVRASRSSPCRPPTPPFIGPGYRRPPRIRQGERQASTEKPT